jgi:CRP-like cAMP-binding protein
MENFHQFLLKYLTFSKEEWEKMKDKIKVVNIKKGEYFLMAGNVSRRVGWIESGVMRYTHTNDEGEEFTKYFIKEGQFASAIESFNTQTASEFSIQALTDVQLYVFTFDDFIQMRQTMPIWGELAQKITEKSLLEKMQRIQPMVVQDAKTRYKLFMKQQPDVLQRVSLGYIANYLGMTQQSLSRLRKQFVLEGI